MLPPVCQQFYESGPAKVCDSCDALFAKGSMSLVCPRCRCRYHEKCLKYYADGQDLDWDAARCRKCDEELRKVGIGEGVKIPLPKVLTLADSRAAGSNLFTSGDIKLNLLKSTPATLVMTQ